VLVEFEPGHTPGFDFFGSPGFTGKQAHNNAAEMVSLEDERLPSDDAGT
jgi:hypothetical protein